MMPKSDIYEYAVLRLVPRVEREEFINIGVLLLCRPQKYGNIKYHLNQERCLALFPDLDIDVIENQLKLFPIILKGEHGGGLIASQDLHERFRWLTANRSTMIQCSAVHIGMTVDAEKTLSELFKKLV
ncbi:MAG TPA: DUF3037 domain-containing protein [Chitinophagales bacterium]|nr:DUF3037 domain-containing protein [Chitinophagales bacterium]